MTSIIHKKNDIDFYSQHDSCNECGGQLLYNTERGEKTCSQCGLIFQENMIDNSHFGRRAITSIEEKTRIHIGPSTDPLFSSKIFLNTYMFKEEIVNPDLKRASKWNSRISWSSRGLLSAYKELKRICFNLGLSDNIKKRAMLLYLKFCNF